LIDGVPRARLGRPPGVFMTDRTHSSSVPIEGAGFHRVLFPTSDGLSLEGIQLGTTAAWPYWILFCPASGMTGFGANAGEPTEEGVYADAESAYTYLTQNLRVPPTHYDAGFDRGAKLLDALSRFWPPTKDAFRGIETFRQ